MKRYIWIVCGLLCLLSVAQAQEKTSPFWGKQEVYLVNQTVKTFELVNQLLAENPPSTEAPSLARRSALMLLDGVLHDTRLDGNKVYTDFIDARLREVVAELQQPLTEGMRIYKLYNACYIVRTPSVVVAYDLYRGAPMKETPSLISDEVMRELVGQCDILFLTHNHSDHVDPVVVDWFLAEGKPVVAPNEVLPENKQVTHVREERIVERTFAVKSGQLSVQILPGHQDALQNNIYVVKSAEGFTFAQTGDQYHKEDLDWLLDVHKKIGSIDVLMINCWANSLYEVIDGFDPKLVLTSHENELGHTIDHRESYWTSYEKLSQVHRPKCLMTWAEGISYKR